MVIIEEALSINIKIFKIDVWDMAQNQCCMHFMKLFLKRMIEEGEDFQQRDHI